MLSVNEKLIEKLKEKGIDINDVLLDVLSREDPAESSKERIEFAVKYLEECKQDIQKKDAVKASEKAYKAAEEVVKTLAEKFKTDEYEEFLREGRWYTYLLGKASKTLSKKLGYWILEGWSVAYDLHVWGFHEKKYSIDDVVVSIKKIEDMLNETKNIIS